MNKWRNFNAKFRMNTYAKELAVCALNALKAVMLSNWDTEGIRAIATFLASTVSQGNIYKKSLTLPKTYSDVV